MNALLVVAQPSKTSLSHAMLAVAAETLVSRGYACTAHDLYAECFNPVQPVAEAGNTVSDDPLVELHCRELREADLILVFHPNWWSQPPAIMKGWIDRVFRLGTLKVKALRQSPLACYEPSTHWSSTPRTPRLRAK
jgi:putative NADPH-quinone reductase